MNLPIELDGGSAIESTDARLAWELAAEISPLADILKRYGLTPQTFRAKLRDAMFRKMIREAKSMWKSDLNVQQRIRLKAAFLVEDSLLDVFKILKNDNSIAAARLEAFEKLVKTADLMPKAKEAAGGGGSFKINIIMGDAPSERVTIDARALGTDNPSDNGGGSDVA